MTTMTIDQKLSARKNNFNIIRLIAASLVLLSHSYPLTGNVMEFFSLHWGVTTGGGIGVAIFFILSGFLVARSLLHSKSPLKYIWSRSLRIFPGLIGVTLVTVFLFGPLFTDLPQSEYWTQQGTYTYLKNIFLYPIQYSLPGVFSTNPIPTINGSLWTLPVEVLMYGVLLLLFMSVKVNKLTTSIVLIAFVVGYHVGILHFHLDWNHQGAILLPGVGLNNFLKLGFLFFLGVFSFVFRNHIRLDPLYCLVALLAIPIASQFIHLGFAIFAFASAYLILFIGFMDVNINQVADKLGDISYGMYIYAFPVQQSVIHSFDNSLSTQQVTWISLLITSLLAYISWHLLEKRVLRYKHIFVTGSRVPDYS